MDLNKMDYLANINIRFYIMKYKRVRDQTYHT
jgi:hypothetical protein